MFWSISEKGTKTSVCFSKPFPTLLEMQEINFVVSFVGNIRWILFQPCDSGKYRFIYRDSRLPTNMSCHPGGWRLHQQLEVECMACSQGHLEVIPLGGGWVGGRWFVIGWWLVVMNWTYKFIYLVSLLIKWYYKGRSHHWNQLANEQLCATTRWCTKTSFCNTTCGSKWSFIVDFKDV